MTQLRIRRPAGDAEVGLSSVLRQHYGQPSARAPPRRALAARIAHRVSAIVLGADHVMRART